MTLTPSLFRSYMKNTNTISFYIGVIFGTGLMLTVWAIATPKTTSTPTSQPTEEPEKW
jgi:hypothetical protein